jgi:hypothetical protein
MPLGFNAYAFPEGVPYVYRLNPEPLRRLWQDLVTYQQETAQRELFYAVGYRGLNDYPFWNDDTGCNTTECRGAVISWAIGNQTSIVESTPVAPGTPKPRLATFLQMEMLSLLEAGVLVIPPSVSTIFSDFGTCFRIGGIVNATTNDGFYAHLASMSGWPLGGSAGQLTEYATLSTAFENMWLMLQRNATAMGMINLSDMKQIPLTAEGVYRYLWNPAAFNASYAGCPSQPASISVESPSASRRQGPRSSVGFWPMPSSLDPDTGSVSCLLTTTPEIAQVNYIFEFTARHYSSPANATVSRDIAEIHALYFGSPYMSLPFPQGDHFFGTSLRGVLGPFQTAVNSKTFDPAIGRDAAPLLGFADQNLKSLEILFLDRVLILQPFVPAGGPSSMYASHVVAQISIHYYHTVAFRALGNAAVAWSLGSVDEAAANATAALAAIDTCLDYLRLGEGNGIWRGMYAAETWTWVIGTRGQIAVLAASIQGLSHPAGPQDVYADNAMMQYECSGHTKNACLSFPLSVFNASIAWDVMVRITCANEGPSCSTTVVGITYSGNSALIELITPLNPMRGSSFPTPVIRFTVDGTPVTPASPIYSGPFTYSAGTLPIRAQAFDAVLGTPYLAENIATMTQN